MTKHWEAVYVDWPSRIFQDVEGHWPDADEESPGVIHEGRRPDGWDARRDQDVRLATMSERSWVNEWRSVIMRAAEDRRKGMVNADDLYAARDRESRQRATSSADEGSFVGAAVGLLREASDVPRDSQMSREWGRDT